MTRASHNVSHVFRNYKLPCHSLVLHHTKYVQYERQFHDVKVKYHSPNATEWKINNLRLSFK